MASKCCLFFSIMGNPSFIAMNPFSRTFTTVFTTIGQITLAHLTVSASISSGQCFNSLYKLHSHNNDFKFQQPDTTKTSTRLVKIYLMIVFTDSCSRIGDFTFPDRTMWCTTSTILGMWPENSEDNTPGRKDLMEIKTVVERRKLRKIHLSKKTFAAQELCLQNATTEQRSKNLSKFTQFPRHLLFNTAGLMLFTGKQNNARVHTVLSLHSLTISHKESITFFKSEAVRCLQSDDVAVLWSQFITFTKPHIFEGLLTCSGCEFATHLVNSSSRKQMPKAASALCTRSFSSMSPRTVFTKLAQCFDTWLNAVSSLFLNCLKQNKFRLLTRALIWVKAKRFRAVYRRAVLTVE